MPCLCAASSSMYQQRLACGWAPGAEGRGNSGTVVLGTCGVLERLTDADHRCAKRAVFLTRPSDGRSSQWSDRGTEGGRRVLTARRVCHACRGAARRWRRCRRRRRRLSRAAGGSGSTATRGTTPTTSPPAAGAADAQYSGVTAGAPLVHAACYSQDFCEFFIQSIVCTRPHAARIIRPS